MKNIFSPLLVGAAFVFGCGGGGGVDSSAEIGSLSASDQTALCNEFLADFPQKTVTCNGQSEMIGVSGSACSGSGGLGIPSGCTATVGEAQDCLTAEYNDPCGSDGSADAAACASLEVPACEGDSSGSD